MLTSSSNNGDDQAGVQDTPPSNRTVLLPPLPLYSLPSPTFPSQNCVLPGINRIILVRHGESLGNVNERAYATTADWKIPLTERGREQARVAGRSIAEHVRRHNGQGKIFFYFSPYLRTRQTLREILHEIDPECIVGMREDPCVAEQQFGNYQGLSIRDHKATRCDYGRFFYRFPNGGESGFDVYNRVSGFIGTMRRDSVRVMEYSLRGSNPKQSLDAEEGMTICIVTHGLALRLFLMRWFHYTVHEFERSYNPTNGRVVVLNPSSHSGGSGGFELSEGDRTAMGLPGIEEQERFRVMNDHSLLDNSEW